MMTRFDDLGLAGYERGEGYRPDGLTARGALSAFAWAALAVGGFWLVRDAIGDVLTRLLQGLVLAGVLGWSAWKALRRPLADDEYATEEERRAARRQAAWMLVWVALILGLAVATYLIDVRHGR
jgi:hypothetical protein